ncbi:RDD family protein [Enterovibrio makurazakiensis]|uniref:RDD family protein n=1 Tax=Enterovibrio makurazakiensis TaxID=2910232 RepID=UPI003D1A1832
MDRNEPQIGSLLNAELDRAKAPKEHNFETRKLSTAPLNYRFLAQTTDSLISILIFMGSFYVLGKSGLDTENVRIYSLVVSVSYYLFSDALPKGKSIGKRLFKISVIDKKTGAYCSLIQSFFRNFLCLILGFIDSIFLLGKKRRRLGDLLARTIVIKDT